MKVTPLKAVTPKAAEELADRLYAMTPNARITSLMADVHRWTGFADAFTHLHTGMPADDRRIVLAAVLADATNLGLSRMADACSVASRRKLAWTAGWHLREDTYRTALAMVVNARGQPRSPHCSAADVPLPMPKIYPPRDAARPSAPSMPTTGTRHPRCSTRTFLAAMRPTTLLPSRPRARPPMSSTDCFTTKRISTSPSITWMEAG